MNKSHLPATLCAAAIVFASSVSNAALVTYTDQAAFMAALPGPASTLDFDSVAAGRIPAWGIPEPQRWAILSYTSVLLDAARLFTNKHKY